MTFRREGGVAEKGKTQSKEPAVDDTSPESELSGSVTEKGRISKKKWIIIAGAVLTLLILVAAGIFSWKFLAGNPGEEKTEEHPSVPETAAVEQTPQDPALVNIFPLAPFKLKIKDDMGEWEFRVSLSLEAASPPVKEEIEKRQEEIRAIMTPILQSREPSALQDVDNKIALKTELIIAVNKLLKKGKIKNLYFTEFFVI